MVDPRVYCGIVACRRRFFLRSYPPQCVCASDTFNVERIATGGGCFGCGRRCCAFARDPPIRPPRRLNRHCFGARRRAHTKEVPKTDASGCRAGRPSCAHSPRGRQARKNPPADSLRLISRSLLRPFGCFARVARRRSSSACLHPVSSSPPDPPTTSFTPSPSPSRAVHRAAHTQAPLSPLTPLVRCRRSNNQSFKTAAAAR